MKKVAIVVQRCHQSVVGGSESLAWQYATLLKDRYTVEVLTTTAVDSISWENELPDGCEERDGIAIRRFKVDIGRTSNRNSYWDSLHERLLIEYSELEITTDIAKQIPWTIALQEEWIRHQGPYSKGLICFLSEQSHNYEAVIFITYLFATTYFGIPQCVKEKCLLVPTLHEEPPAYLAAYKYMVKKVRSCFWNTEAEKRLGYRFWGDIPGQIIGMGINTQKYNPSRTTNPYLLYCGRINAEKGCVQLIDYFSRYKKGNPSDLRLILTGKDEIGLETSQDVELMGFVSEKEKYKLMAGATIFIMPSPYESFSVVTLEAMAQETPVLVNGTCEVLVDHVENSSAGFVYTDHKDFCKALDGLLKDEGRIDEMGRKGRDYVISNYGLERIQKMLVNEIETD